MRGKRPTRKQKEIISNYANLNYKNWLVIKSLHDRLVIKHRYTGTVREIPL